MTAGGQCLRCDHPRHDGATLGERFLWARFAPAIDHRLYCDLCYEEQCILSARPLVVALCLILALFAVAQGEWLPLLLLAVVGAVLWSVGGLFLRSVRERIEERGPARPPGDDPS